MSQVEVNVSQVSEKHDIWYYLKLIGPGIVFGLSLLGVGDTIDVSLAGSLYGYDLYWVIPLSWLCSFVWAGLMGKYQMCNPHGDTIVEGLSRVGAWMVVFVGIAGIVLANVYGSFLISGTTQAMQNLIPPLGNLHIALASVIVMALAYYAMFKGYGFVEVIFKVFLIALAVCFIGQWIWTAPTVGEIAGAFVPSLPEGSSALALTLLGATGVTFVNILYPYFIKEKGWKGIKDVKLIRIDLGISSVVMIIIDLAIIGVAAALMTTGQGKVIEEAVDVANEFKYFLGDFGFYLFWVGLFVAGFTTYWGLAFGLADVVQDTTKILFKDKEIAIGPVKKNLGFHITFFLGIVAPVLWLFTEIGFVQLTIIAFCISAVFAPLLAIGVFIITNKIEWAGPEGKAKTWENVFLIFIIVLTVFYMIRTFMDMF